MNFRYELSGALSQFVRINGGIDLQWRPTQLQLAILRFDPFGNGDAESALHIAANANGYTFQPGAYIEAEMTPVRGLIPEAAKAAHVT